MREILIFMEFFSIWIAPVIGGPAVNNLLEKDLFVAKASFSYTGRPVLLDSPSGGSPITEGVRDLLVSWKVPLYNYSVIHCISFSVGWPMGLIGLA